MPALVGSHELKRTARMETKSCSTPYSQAQALDSWMRKHIRYDSEKNSMITLGRMVPYRNSLETFVQGQGVCGEQALLYIVLCQYAGLESRLLLKRLKRDESHAVTRVYTNQGKIQVDHTNANGFDISVGQGSYKELTYDQIEEHYLLWNQPSANRHSKSTSFTSTSTGSSASASTTASSSIYGNDFNSNDFNSNDFTGLPAPLPSHTSRPYTFCIPSAFHFSSLAYLAAALILVPTFWPVLDRGIDLGIEIGALIPRSHPLVVSDEGRSYLALANKAARARFGPAGEEAVWRLAPYFVKNKDHTLDEDEAYRLYLHVLSGVKGN